MIRIATSLLLLLPVLSSAQPIIHIPYSAAPQIDGSFTANEWDPADTVHINLPVGVPTKVMMMHDSSNLYVAFVDNLQSGLMRFPEVLIDLNNSKSASWEMDDWWFHVSATDCEYQGQYGNYDSCMLVRPNWLAEKNFQQSGPNVDTVEMSIPFATLGLTLPTHDTIGLSFDLTNTASSWDHWPVDANRTIPSTWGLGVFLADGVTSIVKTKEEFQVKAFPNPNYGLLKIESPKSEIQKVQILDPMGKLMLENESVNQKSLQVEVDQLHSGMYLVKVILQHGSITERIFLHPHN